MKPQHIVFTLQQIKEQLEALESRKKPFHGQTAQVWRNGKIVRRKTEETETPEDCNITLK